MKYTTIRRMSLGAAAAALGTLAALAADPAPPPLDAALAKAAPGVVSYLKKHDYKVVGVLPFEARVGNGPLRNDFGTLHRNLARRLEVALVLAMQDGDGLMLVSGAGDSAAKGSPRANHRTPSGRRELFRINERYFHPAWGNAEVKPDVFLTGEAELSPDFRTIKVTVRALDGRDETYRSEPVQVGECIPALTERRTLTESGVTYARRGGGLPPPPSADDDKQVTQGPSPYIQPAWAPKENKPAEDPEKAFRDLMTQTGVRLEVCYDGEVQPIRRGSVRTPNAGEKVSFRLKNEGPQTYGVVLRVNGQSVIFREEKDPSECYKLILNPNQEALEINGFQKNQKKVEAFEVKSPEDSRRLAGQYGPLAGTIDLVVFRAITPKDKEALAKADAKRPLEVVAIGSRAVQAGEKEATPGDLGALKSRLKKRGTEPAGRGLIGAGAESDRQVEEVPFDPYPDPVGSVTVRYYEPK